MRISLLHNSTLYPLAGVEGESAREHPHTVGFRISARINRQLLDRVRADRSSEADRGNLATTVEFTTRRHFATALDSARFSCEYESAIPRHGTLIMQPVMPDGTYAVRHLLSAVIRGPRRRLEGCTVYLDYSADGGEIIFISDPGVSAGALLDADGSELTDADGSVLTDP